MAGSVVVGVALLVVQAVGADVEAEVEEEAHAEIPNRCSVAAVERPIQQQDGWDKEEEFRMVYPIQLSQD